MEKPKIIQSIQERLAGGAWSRLAEIVTEATVEYAKPAVLPQEGPRAPEGSLGFD